MRNIGPPACRCYGTRTSIDCVRPGLKYNTFHDKRVAYQITKPTICDEDVLRQFKKDIAKYGAKDVQVRGRIQSNRELKDL